MPLVSAFFDCSHVRTGLQALVLPAAAVLKQLSFKKALAHEELVSEVACQAESTGRNRSLGVIYDEITRKHWQEQSGKLGDRFDLEAVVGTRGSEHAMLLERAKDQFDAGKNKASSNSHVIACAISGCDRLPLVKTGLPRDRPRMHKAAWTLQSSAISFPPLQCQAVLPSASRERPAAKETSLLQKARCA